MRFEFPRCPECGELATGTLETIPGEAKLTFAPDGSCEYSGETDVFWDGQTTDTDPGNDAPLLICPNGHSWPSFLLD